MEPKQEKLHRLALVARRYYLEDRKQSDIAQELGVSRPLISRMLSEARDLGVVKITIQEPGGEASDLLERLRQYSGLRDGVLVEDGADNDETNQRLSEGAVSLLRQLRTRCLGVGWGYLIGQLVTWLQKHPQENSTVTDICPLVGNASIPARNYQSNENVRLIAQQLGAAPHFLYLPALPESLEEKQLLCSTEVYRQIQAQWNRMDTALVNIGDYPSSPDFASLVRYGSLLQQEHTCGRLLIYYFNEEGKVIRSDQDFAIQIPLETLRQCPNIIGVCSANTSVKALRGALRSGVFSHIVTRAALAKELLA
ncbi:sugar-binding transcriptional regulator [uncultured Subdoligranulum sp.]|uniref:Transcriptional regulator n=1 Tax=Candidatus Gemmiger excrementavium TaxID=2838608 RepID=A0A9D2F2X0_9FIRM|nr:sugar-binding domain-containing protein [uncultured Subdoligranulum sp.]HIZ48524.1 transcriptional regulator [Candidatus Gemmiger excrementavium]